MLNLFKSSRCNTCYTERIVRECPRNKKKLCWQCCNALRCDSKCPKDCPFAPQDVEGSMFPVFKADSLTEAEQVLRLYIDMWVGRENPHLDNQTPINIAKENPSKLVSWLTGFQYPPYFPLSYLMQKLGIPTQEDKTDKGMPAQHEDCVHAYMNALVRLAWDELRPQSINQNPMEDLALRYRELLQAVPTLSKISTYSIIHSGIGEDGNSAMVYLELNHKQDWTLVLSNSSGEWKVRQNIAGGPQAYFSQNKVYTDIAEALGKAEDDKVWELLSTNLKIYPDSPDLYYYRALYWQLVKQNDKAAVDFFNAISLDNAWIEPYFHLGTLYLNKNDYAQARFWFNELCLLQPDNPNAQNNLAACYAGEKKFDEAKEIWLKLLELYPTFEVAAKNLERLERG
ncbi:MAG: hypothetical protein PHY48_14765 [Candidatus Cloacimonetes bacterium]|nr:hypothetical protein [Candidatus Cloacimonadota bacterium]